jgi:hypothetical protein
MVIFCCGVVTGALVIRTAFPPPSASRGGGGSMPGRPGMPAQFQSESLLRRMQGPLALSTNQSSEIQKIMLTERAKPLWTNIDLEMQRELNLVDAEIRGVLNPDQQKKWTELRQSQSQSRPRRPDGPPTREGDSFRGRTNRLRTNGVSTNLLTPVTAAPLSATNGP